MKNKLHHWTILPLSGFGKEYMEVLTKWDCTEFQGQKKNKWLIVFGITVVERAKRISLVQNFRNNKINLVDKSAD